MNNDLISREALKTNMKKAEEQADTFEMLVEFYEQIIDNAPTVEPRIEYGTDGQPYKLSMTNGKEYERPKGEWLHNSDRPDTLICSAPACCYRCAKHDTCEISKIGPWGMVCSGFTLEEPGSKDISKKPIIYDEGYYEAIQLVKTHVTQMKDYYKQGAMCSLSESIQGEATCDEILKYLEELAKR